MSFTSASIKDSLKRIEAKLDKLIEDKTVTVEVNTPVNQQADTSLTAMQARMANARAARKVNTGQGGRG